MRVIGVEVAKASVLCCVLEKDTDDPARGAKTYKPQRFQVTKEDLKSFVELGDLYVIEPTGVYSRIWFETLQAHGKDVRKVSPKRVTHLRRYSGVETKSDRYDAYFLALYGIRKHADPKAWLSPHAEELRDLVLQHRMLTKACTQSVNRIWRSLATEWPEACISRTGTKPKVARNYGDPKPPALWRLIAGEEVKAMARRKASLRDTVGLGLSDLTKVWAQQVVTLERQQYGNEQQIDALLQLPEFEAYHRVFDSFDFGPMTRATLLSRIYPFESFLHPDGRPIIEWVWTDNGRSRRHRSLGAFRLSLGMGTVVKQSGDSKEEKAGGPAYARATLFQHVKTKIVMTNGYNGPARHRAAHCRYYGDFPDSVPHRLAVLKTASRITKDLFKALLSSH